MEPGQPLWETATNRLSYDKAKLPVKERRHLGDTTGIDVKLLLKWICFKFWFVMLLALRPFLAYCANLG
jgi:hypothetical protein